MFPALPNPEMLRGAAQCRAVGEGGRCAVTACAVSWSSRRSFLDFLDLLLPPNTTHLDSWRKLVYARTIPLHHLHFNDFSLHLPHLHGFHYSRDVGSWARYFFDIHGIAPPYSPLGHTKTPDHLLRSMRPPWINRFSVLALATRPSMASLKYACVY